MAADLVGRAAESERLAALVSRAGGGPAKLLLLGDPGIGKTRLLAAAGELAGREGFRVVAGSGAPPPAASASIVRRLVSPLLSMPGGLPEPLRNRVAELVAGTAGPVAGGVALSAVVRRIARDRPLAILVDDLQDAGPATVDTLSVFSRALTDERVMLVFAARGPLPPNRLDADVPVWHVGPLQASEAAILLDRQPAAPTGWWRGEAVRHARGNPLVLIELAGAARGGHGLTVPARIREAHAGQLAALPDVTRRVLLCAAAAEGADDLATVLAAAGAELADCAPAELAGLLSVSGDRAGFPAPTVRLACYFGAEHGDRLRAHRALAEALPHGAERRSWHLALAAEQPDEEVAVALEIAATAATGQGDHPAAAAALERAAQASADGERAARRYASAALQAALAGDYVWCRQLASRVRASTEDTDVLGAALAVEAQHRALHDPDSGTPAEIRALLDGGLAERGVAFALAFAAEVDLLVSGDPERQAGLGSILTAARAVGARSPAEELDAVRLFRRGAEEAVAVVAAVVRPDGVPPGGAGVPVLEMAQDDVFLNQPLVLGIGEWLADRPSAAMNQLRRARQLLRRDNAATAHPFAYVVLLDALAECGLWREAGDLAEEAETVAAAGGLPVLGHAVRAQAVSLLTRRGEETAALARLAVLDREVAGGRMADCLVHQAYARAHAATGDHVLACEHFEATFEPSGEPVHFAWSYRALTEFARSAARANRHEAVFRVLARMAPTTGRSPRRAALVRQAAALVAGPGDPGVEPVLRTAATSPGGRERPYEHALAMVDYADWLRARRRFRDARPLLSAARDVFVRLGAARDARDARARLRAAGVSQDGPDQQAFELLTAQQQFIARLAAEGLTNRAIADRLALSPRTVGSHLYRIYPQLGVVSRQQLHGVIPGTP